jgi:hypothetical protein
MKLYAVTVSGCYPKQLVNVYDTKESAHALEKYILENCPQIAQFITVESVSDFWPSGFTEADKTLLDLCDKFHAINTKGIDL